MLILALIRVMFISIVGTREPIIIIYYNIAIYLIIDVLDNFLLIIIVVIAV